MAAYDVRYDPAKYLGQQTGSDSTAHTKPRWELAHHRDPSLAEAGILNGGRRGIEWVRPTELAHRVSTSVVAQGLDLHGRAHAWTRAQFCDSNPTVSDRVGRLAPVSAFGRGAHSAASPDAVGR